MSREQPAPILLPAPEPNHANQALLVFLHGFDDDAESYTCKLANGLEIYFKVYLVI